MFVDDLVVHPFHLLFFHQNTLKVRHHPGGDAVEHVVILLFPADRFVISWVLNNSWLVLLHHADAVMKLLSLCCVEHVQTLLTYELIADIWVFLLEMVSESFLTVEVSADAVWAHKLCEVTLCCR